MRHVTPNSRGMALVMAMIVVVLITLLVAGAISFTGTERAASEVQAQDASMSACVQAARNLFLSRVDRTVVSGIDRKNPEVDMQKFAFFQFNEDLRGTNLRTGHMGQLAGLSAKVAKNLEDPNASVRDMTGDPKSSSSAPIFFIVTAVCREDIADQNSPEREIEFLVQVSI